MRLFKDFTGINPRAAAANSLDSHRSHPDGRRARRRCSPRLEPLEDRVTLSTLTVTNTNDSGAGSLRQAIADSHGGDTVGFSLGIPGQTIALSSGELTINHDLTIDAPLYFGLLTLDVTGTGLGQSRPPSRVFEITSGSVVIIKNLAIDNAASDKGGGILNSGTLTLDNCVVDNCTAEGNGGDIYNDGTMTISSGYILEGRAQPSGDSDGGGIYNAGTLKIDSSTIGSEYPDFGNFATGNGGGIYNAGSGSATITNCKILSNSAVGNGGGIYNAGGTVVITSSSISGNSASDGGGIYYQNQSGVLNIDDKQSISGNTPNDIALFETPNPLVVNTILDVTNPYDNYTSLREAVDYAIGHGGADAITFDPAVFAAPQTIVLTQGELHLTQAGTGNPITISGPDVGVTISVSADKPDRVFQIDAGVTASLSGLTITGGQAAPGGGVSNAGALTLTHCIVTGNSAFGAGGGIFNDASGTLRVDASAIRGNTAATQGGGIANAGSLVIVNNSTIGGTSNADGNLARFGEGGGIYNFGSGSLNISTATIEGNSASDGGGIYYASSSSQRAQILRSTISSNTATGEGGGIFDESGPMTITLSTISGNTASINGGGLLNQGFGVTLLESTVSGNTAVFKGGGIYNTFGTMLTIAGGNTIGGPDKNSATDGGGIYNAGTLNILDGTTVAGNSATDGGGGVYNDTFSFVTIIDSEIGVGNLFALRNTATNGAGIYNLGYLTLTDGSISDNFATGSGGGIYNSGLLAMAGTTLTNNHAAEFGGAIYLDASGGLVIVGVSIFGNSAGATNGGGGIAIRPGGLLLYIVSYVYDNTRGDVVDLT